MKIPSWDEYKINNQKSQSFISLFEDANVKSSYNFPVMYEEKMMGYFCIEFTGAEFHMSNEDINRIRNICTQTGIALYHADLYVKAKESMHSKEEFIANISNEFKVPLSFIVEYSELLAKTELERSKELVYLNGITKSSRQLLELTDDIIDISEIESDIFKLHYEHIDSSVLIKEVINSVQARAENKDINIDLITAVANINADKRMLTKILYILLNNSIKFTRGHGNISVKTELEDANLIVSIDGTKTAMSQENQDNFFSDFKDLDTVYISSEQASGLGLSIAKKLVELHNGSIHIESISDNGSRFWFSLPKASRE